MLILPLKSAPAQDTLLQGDGPNQEGEPIGNYGVQGAASTGCLGDVLERIRQAPSVPDTPSKSSGLAQSKAHAYAAMSSEHQSALIDILNGYVGNVMGYCSSANLNPAHAFQYLHGKLPLNSLTEWQAFCQLRGMQRVSSRSPKLSNWQAFT